METYKDVENHVTSRLEWVKILKIAQKKLESLKFSFEYLCPVDPRLKLPSPGREEIVCGGVGGRLSGPRKKQLTP